MNRLLVASFVVLAVIVASTVVFRGQPQSVELSAAAMPSLAELHVMAGVHRLRTKISTINHSFSPPPLRQSNSLPVIQASGARGHDVWGRT